MVRIEYAYFKNVNRILWLRYVRDVNLGQHCMKSLVGTNDERVKWWSMSLPENMELKPAPFYYLCGVEKGWNWPKNLHLAFIEKEGSVIEIDDDFIRCRIVNAERVPITPDYIDRSLPHADEKAYNTCRNWWFANYLAKTAFRKKHGVVCPDLFGGADGGPDNGNVE